MKGFSRRSDLSFKTCSEGSSRKDWDSDDTKLELRLGPPGDEDWSIKKDGITKTSKTNRGTRDNNSSTLLSLGSFSNMNNGSNQNFPGSYQENSSQVVGNTTVTPWSISCSQYKQSLHPAMGKESLQIKDNAEKKGFSPASANNTAVHNTSQKRITSAPGSVVGWPPIRSFRKNIASGCASKLPAETKAINEVSTKIACKRQSESCRKGFFVKINMDGVPIGRKVDLKACDSYEKLSSAVDELFRGLLAVQNDPSVNNTKNSQGEKSITGLLDGSGEYTLVYEDNEGDRMLVGDVPWHMFVSTVKRLRVLKSSELSSLLFGSKQEREPT
ncbi:Auxin-responsive protein [Heracleum sosnowskyi]|uniref:Auxin-responsive protein n=1 Tax=Heracleum sosnowskyi TaxID=360622 RepID=A0AAD8H8I6_9APIA|nr:Auxin-responsive protein [Heracleum sosnowskyi]